MDGLVNKGLIDKSSSTNLLTNKLVLIVPDGYRDKIKSINDPASANINITSGGADSVPAGFYRKQNG